MMITLKFGAGEQQARIEGESKSGKHWIIRRKFGPARGGAFYDKTCVLKKTDYRIMNMKEIEHEYRALQEQTNESI